MKEIEKRRTSKTTKQTISSGRTERRENKSRQGTNPRKANAEETEAKITHARLPSKRISHSNTGSETSEVYDDLVMDDMEDADRSEEAPINIEVDRMTSSDNNVEVSEQLADLEKDRKPGSEELSDSETIKDSVSSQCESLTGEDEKPESSRDKYHARERKIKKATKLQPVASNGNLQKTINHKGSSRVAESNILKNSKLKSDPPLHSSESSDGLEREVTEEDKEAECFDGISIGAQSVGSGGDILDTDGECQGESALVGRIEAMETRIKKLEEELREVAALEISLYSIVPEHGSSAHKVHTPARRLSRLYIHACKYWTLDKRASIAKSTVSGLILVARSCASDVSRLTFWLSNTIALRKIIYQAFGSSCQSSPVTRFSEEKEIGSRKPSLQKWKGSSANKRVNGVMQNIEDWQETGTFTSALEKAESWMFSRVVESVWWQALTPYMQSPAGDASPKSTLGKLLGPPLGDQQQGFFSIDLWKNAFQDASQRICPVRAGGHECGCLCVLARLVMEQCIARLDVAMFNAILRESANEIPTDPVSDPIVDSKVLPIPAGDLSFGSGAQLKNTVGNWSRWLTDMFGMDADDPSREGQDNSDEDDDRQGESVRPKSFILLNALSDLLMLPKDMLLDKRVREEVCPSISLTLVKRILCNFTPDEFCPDPVPGTVLEAINAECIVERRLLGESARVFPYTAGPVTYSPPSIDDVTEKIAEAAEKPNLARNASAVQRKGYTSDEELEELDSPLMSIIDKLPPSPTVMVNGNGKHKEQTNHTYTSRRYELLREVWST